jgi:cytochrome-b5 reductase
MSKPYTVITESFTSQNKLEQLGKQICLMIKTYDDGSLTPILKRLELNSFVEISNFTGSFQITALDKCNELILICAGSGFTPMIKLVKEGLSIANIS